MADEVIRIKETDLDLATLQTLLREVDEQLFQSQGERISGFTLADPAGDDAGHNVIVVEKSAQQPPELTLQTVDSALDENAVAEALVALEDKQSCHVRCYGTALVKADSGAVIKTVVAICDPASAILPTPKGGMSVTGKISTFGGPDDTGMGEGENLAWIENEEEAAAYPGYFLPAQPGLGFGRRLNTKELYLACRWNYDVTPKSFLAQPTTICIVTNPANGRSFQARPIDFGPSSTDPNAKDRTADLSPALATALGLDTDQICTVQIPTPGHPLAGAVVPAPAVSAGSNRAVVMLTGDYVGRHVRQAQAHAAGCRLTIEFHFNSNGPGSKGSHVFYKHSDAPSQAAAQIMQDAFNKLFSSKAGWGGTVLDSHDAGGRSSFIDAYSNPAMLIEPLFVSNKEQADWIHNDGNMKNLAAAVAGALVQATKAGDVIGLSIGHLGKDSSPGDRGADCIDGDTEATHGEKLALLVSSLLGA